MDAIEWERRHGYLSTACQHGLHQHCRLRCKWCAESCLCMCHLAPAPQPPDDLGSGDA